MPTNDFLPFATGGGANVESQADYVADATTGTGFQSGLAVSKKLNKVWRQASFMVSVLAQYIANITQQSVLDDGDAAGKLLLLEQAIGSSPLKIRHVSADTTVLVSDKIIDVTTTGGPVKVTFPIALGAAALSSMVRINKITADANPVNIYDDSPQEVDVIIGAASVIGQIGGWRDVFSNGTHLRSAGVG